MPESDELVRSRKELIKALNEVTRSIREMQNTEEILLKRRYQFYFVRGVIQGIGVLVAALIIVPLLIPIVMFFFRQIEWVPIVGNFAKKVIMQVEQSGNFAPTPGGL